jgi:predicted nucleic acid-binding Zn ribbon protein
MSSRKYTDQSLKMVIQELLKDRGFDKKFHELEIFRCYREVVGEVISKKTREIYMREKTLVLKMDSGVLKQELSYQRSRIADLINEKLGSIAVEKVEVW